MVKTRGEKLRLRKTFYRTILFGVAVLSQQLSHLKKTKQALMLIQGTAPDLFKKVLRLKAILIYPGSTEMGCVFERSRIYVNQPKYVSGTSVSWWASTIVHEAWHIDQYKRGITEYGAKAERGAYRVQRRFLRTAHDASGVRWLDKMYKLQWWKPEQTRFKKRVGYDMSADDMKNKFEVFVRQYKSHRLRVKKMRL